MNHGRQKCKEKKTKAQGSHGTCPQRILYWTTWTTITDSFGLLREQWSWIFGFDGSEQLWIWTNRRGLEFGLLHQEVDSWKRWRTTFNAAAITTLRVLPVVKIPAFTIVTGNECRILCGCWDHMTLSTIFWAAEARWRAHWTWRRWYFHGYQCL